MRGVKGCFVCGILKRVSTRNSKEEVPDVVNKLKSHQPPAILNVEYLEVVVEMTIFGANTIDEISEDDVR